MNEIVVFPSSDLEDKESEARRRGRVMEIKHREVGMDVRAKMVPNQSLLFINIVFFFAFLILVIFGITMSSP